MSHTNELQASYEVMSLLEAATDSTENMLDNMPGVLVVLNKNLEVIRASREFVELISGDLESVLGYEFTRLFKDENLSVLHRQFKSLKGGGALNKRIEFELEITLPDQQQSMRQFFWQATLLKENKSAEGELISLSGQDLSELYKSEEKLRNIFANLPLGVLMIDSSGNIKEVLSQFSEVLFGRTDLLGLPFASLIAEAENIQDRRIVEGLYYLNSCFGQTKIHYLAIEKYFPKTLTLVEPSTGSNKWLNINYQPILKFNRIEGLILLIEDATETMQAKKEMERVSELERQIQTVYEAASRDTLTGLYTRLFMKESVKALISNFHLGSIEELSVLMMDIDHFKNINDAHGHKAGDAVISEVGRIILSKIRETDVAIRYGGEEFLILLPSKKNNMTSGKVIGERIRADVEKYRLTLDSGKEIKVTISGGVACCGKEEPIDLAIERADDFLYQAKRSGRNCLVAEGDK